MEDLQMKALQIFFGIVWKIVFCLDSNVSLLF
jgi:hypothetical protein